MIIDVDGRSVHAATGGVDPDPEDPVVILIHGAGMDSTIWQLQTRYLAYRNLQTIALDLPGHGRSEGPPLESIEAMAAFVVSLMDAAGWEGAHLVGHSMGSLVALEAGASLGGRCGSITIMGAAAAMPVHPQLLADAEANLPAAAALMAAWGHAKPAHLGLNPTPGLWMTGGARALVERSDPGVLATDFRACAAYESAPDAAGSITAPVTIVIGQGDKMTPAKAGRALATLLSHPQVIELPDVGHSMMTESPRAVRSAILDTVLTSAAS
jgi:pimeloyl-ACP methyl ester carboxylesterase